MTDRYGDRQTGRRGDGQTEVIYVDGKKGGKKGRKMARYVGVIMTKTG